MANRRPAANPAPDGLPVREQLERILASPAFQQSDRLKRFLRFIVLQAMEGHGDQLKEYVIGVQVFGKEESFDPRTDPIVRVQARRLRAKLVHHYREEGRKTSGSDHAFVGPLRISPRTTCICKVAIT